MRTDEQQIRQLLAEQVTAMRDRDADRLVARYAPDAVKFDLAPPLQHTGSEVHDAEGVQKWFATFEGPIDFEIRDPAITVGGGVAFCYSLNRLSATPVGSPQGFELWFRATVCLRKIDGRWWISHEHTSTPFHMDGSFQSAVDLKP